MFAVVVVAVCSVVCWEGACSGVVASGRDAAAAAAAAVVEGSVKKSPEKSVKCVVV